MEVYAGRPGGVSGYPRTPGVGEFRDFKPRQGHTRINSFGLFLVHELTCVKRESVSKQHWMRELATLHERARERELLK